MNDPSAQAGSTAGEPGGAHILIVEDSGIQAELLRRFLVKDGFSVSVATNGRNGLEAMGERKPDLVITDVAMPTMNGFELCRAVKADPELRHIPVILLTFLAESRDLIEGLAAGADTYVFKPFEAEDLGRKIRLLLDHPYRERQQDPLRPITFEYQGNIYAIAAGRERILHFLITTYENAVRQNQERINAQIALQDANDTLAVKRVELEESRALLAVRERQQGAAAELGKEALSGMDISLVFDKALSLVAGTLEIEYSLLLELLPEGGELLLRAGRGWKEGLVGHETVSATAETQAGYTLVSGGPVVVEDLRQESRFSGAPLLRDHGVVSGVSVVVAGEGRTFGVLGAHTAQYRKFSQDDVNFLQAVANVLSAAICRKLDEEEIHRLATTDSLTGAANRGEFQLLLAQAIKHAERYHRPVSVIMYDLDRFKEVNDTFGHDAGDVLLVSLSGLVQANIRASDVLGRLAGDEFLILVPENDANSAALLAEKLRQLIADYDFKSIGRISASFGVAHYRPHDDPTSLLKRVDMALYRAKEKGRNQVYAQPDDDSGPEA